MSFYLLERELRLYGLVVFTILLPADGEPATKSPVPEPRFDS